MSEADQVVPGDVRVTEGVCHALPPREGWLTMKEAAKMMGYSYFWLAHNWKRLRLQPTNFGARRMFKDKELDEWLTQHRFTYKGRPVKGRKRPQT